MTARNAKTRSTFPQRAHWVQSVLCNRILETITKWHSSYFIVTNSMQQRPCVIWGFHRDVHEICAPLGYYALLYRRFGTTYRSHIQSSRSSRTKAFSLKFLILEKWDLQVVPKRLYRTTTRRCVISQTNAYFNRVIFISLKVLRYSRNSPQFMEPRSSLPHSQQPATCP